MWTIGIKSLHFGINMPCTVLNNMSKCRALMDKTKANRFLHISPCLCAAGTTLPRGRSQEGNQTLKTQLIHIWLVSLWRRDLSTPVIWNKNSTYYRYLHTLHYITLHCIALHYITLITLHYMTLHTYIHTSIHPYIHTSIHPYIIHPYIHTSIHPYIHTSIHTYIHPYIHPSIHTYIHAYICSFLFVFAGRFKKDITHNLYRFVYTYLCAVLRKLHSFFWLGSGTHNVVVERVCVGNQSKTK